jgi:NADPH:quinone reductase-like Zn-dependent oxidoreductase
VVEKSQIIIVPNEIDKEQLGGVPMAGTTAWLALFENAQLKKGQSVLINGGSSGVGHFAIQIAKAYGATVTSVSSAKNMDFCRSIGADYTIDYQKEDFSKLNRKFDIVFDVVFNSSFNKVKNILTSKGCYIGTTPSLQLIFDIITFRRAKFVSVRPDTKVLTDIVRLMKNKEVTVHIDRVFPLEEVVEAHKYMETSRTVGKVIIKIEQ